MKNKKSVFTRAVGGTCIGISLGLICITAILLVIFGFTFFSAKQTDSFYHNIGDWDADYLPLIEPYKAVRLTQQTTWNISLHVSPDNKEIYYYLSISEVSKIAVENKVIMVYTPYSKSLTDREKRVGQKVLHWFVMIPDQKIETGFETEEEFLAYIHTLGIDKPSWVEPDVAYRQFAKTGCLDWISNCK